MVALDKNFHMKCYNCEDCGKPLSTEADENSCSPWMATCSAGNATMPEPRPE